MEAQLSIEDTNTGKKAVKRVPLLEQSTQQPVATVADAIKALERLKVQREHNALPVLKRTPKLNEAADGYFKSLEKLKDAKKASTIAKEMASLAIWREAVGHVRVDKLTRALINRFVRIVRRPACWAGP